MEKMINFFSPEVTYSLGYMLLHMMWQGCIIALVLGFFLVAMRKSSAQSRYGVAVISMALFPLWGMLTFARVLKNTLTHTFSATQGQSGGLAVGSSGIVDSFLALYKSYLPIIVFIWFLGITILVLRHMGLLIYVERLKSYWVSPVPDALVRKVKDIAKQYALKRQVGALLSQKVQSPMIIGHFKPVLLIPGTTLDQLSEKEMEALLHHEMAHVKRNDYLVNIFQHIIEILFFFHPATWWVSGIVRKEREECCDAFAIKNEEDKINLARALTTLHQNQAASVAMAFTGNKNGLLGRINNLFGKSRMATFSEGIVVAFFFFFSISLMSFILKGNDGVSESHATLMREIDNYFSDGKHVMAKVDSTGKLHSLVLDGEKMERKELGKYQPDIDSMLYSWEYEEVMRRKAHADAKNPKPRSTGWSQSGPNSQNWQESKDESRKEYRWKNNNSENVTFNLNVDEVGSKVKMRAGEVGFAMDVEEGNEKVQMNFGPDGFYINVVENGKTVFKMDANASGLKMDVKDKGKNDSVRKAKGK
jgi:beta-lactamase regulating signal transducer with metallopeptidase domain